MNGEVGIHWRFLPEPRGVVTVQRKRHLSRRLFRPTCLRDKCRLATFFDEKSPTADKPRLAVRLAPAAFGAYQQWNVVQPINLQHTDPPNFERHVMY
jgi:hypothetical protein